MICKNCQFEFIGNYCNDCGQSANVKRINFKYLIQEISNGVFQLNRGFFFTTKEILINPGHSIRNFIQGKRIQHYKPIAYLIVVSTIYVISMYLIEGKTMVDYFIAGIYAYDDSSKISALDYLSKYQIYLPFLILLVFSFASYLSFFKSKYNYIEHFVLNIYVTGQQLIIYTIFNLIVGYEGFYPTLHLLISIAFVFLTYIQFFKNKTFINKVFLTILTYIYFLITIIVAIYLSGFIWGAIN